MTDPDHIPMADAEQMTDEQLHAFIGDAHEIVQAEAQITGGMADLIVAPFNPEAQKRLAELLGSEQLQRATRAAQRIKGGDR